MPLGLTKAVISIHNSIVDLMISNQKNFENHVNKLSVNALNYIRTRKLPLVLNILLSLVICALCFALWYLYGHSLPELKNTDKLSAIFNFFLALGTVLLTFYAWFGYKNQKSEEYKKDKRIVIITTNLRSINEIMNKYDLTFKLMKHFIKENTITIYDTKYLDKFQREYNLWNNNLGELLILIHNLRSYQPQASCFFPELSLFGVSLEDIKKLSSCMAETIASINELQKSIYDIKKRIEELNNFVLEKDNNMYNSKSEELIILLDEEINHLRFEEPFNKLMELGRQIIYS